MEKNCKVLLFVTAFALGAGLSGSAEAGHYGMAGCGIGSLAFKDKPGKIQIIAATLNDIISPQTSAITSGTSGCTEESSREEASLFIQTNQEALKKDIAKGSGESVVGLSKILRCNDSNLLGIELQKNYGKIFPSYDTTPRVIEQSIESAITKSNDLAGTCLTLI